MGRTEVVAVILIIIVLVVLVAVAVQPHRPHIQLARLLKDASQLKQIHAALVTFSSGFDDQYPLPGLLALSKQGSPVASGEDFTLNHTANIYSMMVTQNWLTPGILVSPRETAPHVTVFELGPDGYDPAEGVFWDESFVMSIHDPAVGANASYAHLVAVGDRRSQHWRNTGDASVPVVGTRAPAPSRTANWVANICYADNHTELIEDFYPGTTFDTESGTPAADNIYTADSEHPNGPHAAADAFLAVYIRATRFSVEDVYDPPAGPRGH